MICHCMIIYVWGFRTCDTESKIVIGATTRQETYELVEGRCKAGEDNSFYVGIDDDDLYVGLYHNAFPFLATRLT